jgi:hypothetical protein
MRPTVSSGGFIDLSEDDRTDQHAIAFDERQIGRRHQLRSAEYIAHAGAALFSKQLRQHRAGLHVDLHRCHAPYRAGQPHDAA